MLSLLTNMILLLVPVSLFFGNALIEIIITCLTLLFFASMITSKSGKRLQFFNDKWFIAISLFWLFITLNSLGSQDVTSSLKASISFIRFPLFALAVRYAMNSTVYTKNYFFRGISYLLIIVFANSLLQLATTKDIFGNYIIDHGNFFRLTTFAGKPRVGYEVTFILLPLIGYYVDLILKAKFLNRSDYFIIPISIICGILIVVISGERMAITVLFLSVGICAVSVFKQINKKIIFIITAFCVLITSMILIIDPLRDRMIDQTINQISKPKDDLYGKIYTMSWRFFSNHTLLGIKTNQFYNKCLSYKADFENSIEADFKHHDNAKHIRCGNHPHNWHIQTLTENGLIGEVLFLVSLMYLAFKVFRIRCENYGYFAAVCAFVKALPFIPSASFFAVYSTGPFWMAIGIALASIDSLNISNNEINSTST